jgi:hypothetical protein
MGAEAVRDAILRSIVHLPWHLRRSLPWDQGAEMARHAELTMLRRPVETAQYLSINTPNDWAGKESSVGSVGDS